MTKNLPLAGLTIVVTRPQEQAGMLLQGIKALGGTAVSFPLLKINPLNDNALLRELIARLHEFQLAIFISPNAARFGMAAINTGGGLPAGLQIATIGLSSAQALRELGVHKVIAPQHQFDSESLLALPELQNVKDMHIVIFRGDEGRELLADTLKSRGATVEYAACYHRSKPHNNINALLAANPDILGVSSSEALKNLTDMLEPAQREQLSILPLFVSHQRIALAARQLGWQNVINADGGDEGLLAALINWSAQHKGNES